MTLSGATARPGTEEPLILVVDDDRRVRELLEIAFGAQGYRVITAADGEEAVRRSLGERPDLIVLDVRLPKRSGLEVCEMLRHDADGRHVPIVIVSAATEGETRLQAFHRGADDYMVKPFSPRELLARVKRLLARVQDLRVARERTAELERDAARAREDARRAQRELETSGRQLEFSRRLETDLSDTADLCALGGRLLRHVQRELDVSVAALFVRNDGVLEPWSVRGDVFARVAGLGLRADGELARFLAARARPAPCSATARLPELAAETGALARARFELMAPVRDGNGLLALIVAECPRGPVALRARADVLAEIARIAAHPLSNALRVRARVRGLAELVLATVTERASAASLEEAAALLARVAAAAQRSPHARDLVRLGVLAGPEALDPERAYALQRIERADDAGLIADLVEVVAGARDGDDGPRSERVVPINPWDPDLVAVAGPLVAAGWRIAEHRRAGASLADAIHAAIAAGPLDDAALRALEREARAGDSGTSPRCEI